MGEGQTKRFVQRQGKSVRGWRACAVRAGAKCAGVGMCSALEVKQGVCAEAGMGGKVPAMQSSGWQSGWAGREMSETPRAISDKATCAKAVSLQSVG